MCEKTSSQLVDELMDISFRNGLYTGILGGVLGTLICLFASGKIFP